MSFFEELKRRNVIRVAIAYLVASWLLLQMTEVLSSMLPVPEWTGALVFLLLLVALFPVLMFSWLYEMTPEGLKREKDVDRSNSITPDTGAKINRTIIVLLVLAIGGMIADRLIPKQSAVVATDEPVAAAATQSNEGSIAVLPFTDLSADKDQQYFTDGLSEELLNLLVGVEGLHVASRTSSFAFRGSSLGIPEISRALNVNHILEGSVRKSGDRIRITAQLIEAKSDRHLWSDNFDRELVDIFAIQDEIANAIVAALKDEIGLEGELETISVPVATRNLDAYDLYLKARGLFLKREKIEQSIQLFRDAIELDPEFIRAWEGLAAVEMVANDWVYGDGIDHDPLAKEAAERALELDPTLSMPYAVLGMYSMIAELDYISGLDQLRIAVEKDPNNTSAWLWQGIHTKQLGYFDEGIAHLERCLSIDPAYQNCRQHLAEAYLFKGQTEKALELYYSTLESNFHSISDSFVSIMVQQGNRPLALTLADIETELDGAPVIEWIRAIEEPTVDHSAGLARLEEWSRHSETGIKLSDVPFIYLAFRAYDELPEASYQVMRVIWHPEAAEFRTTPQFKQVVRDGGALAYYRAKGFPPQCRVTGDDFDCSD